jgi:hypothetical protein
MAAVAARDRHATKGLFVWSRTWGLRQVAGPGLGATERAIPDTEDPLSVLEHIAQAERGLYVLCDYGPYLAPFGQEEPQLVRRLRELAWMIKTRPVTVLFVGASFPELPALEKEVKVVELPLPEEREVGCLLDLELGRLADNSDVRLSVDVRTREQLVQALASRPPGRKKRDPGPIDQVLGDIVAICYADARSMAEPNRMAALEL